MKYNKQKRPCQHHSCTFCEKSIYKKKQGNITANFKEKKSLTSIHNIGLDNLIKSSYDKANNNDIINKLL